MDPQRGPLEGKARPGTAYVKIGWLVPNVMGGASSVTTKLTGVSFGAVPAYANSAAKAESATTASRVADGGVGTANVPRHVWFSDSSVETARVHSDAFRYNPVGNLLSCNVSGNAATASKLETARRITFEGAASGSALFDGSGDVTVTLSSSAQAPSFLAAHPPGSIYRETTGRSPAAEWGGAWRLVDSLDGFAWLRTDSGRSDNFTAAQFLAAHPVGCIFEWNKAINPGAVYGGTWRQTPSIGAHTFERTE